MIISNFKDANRIIMYKDYSKEIQREWVKGREERERERERKREREEERDHKMSW